MRRTWVIIVMGAAACTSLDGLTDGAGPQTDGGGAPDSSLPSGDASDGGGLPTGDGSPDLDAPGLDANPVGTPFCSLHPADAGEIWFCDDFERAVLQGPWDTIKLSPMAKLTLDETESTSPTRSLRVDVDPGADAQPSAYVRKTLPRATRIRLSYDLRVHAMITQTHGVIGQFITDAPSPSLERIFHRLLVYGNSAEFETVHVPPDGGAGVHTAYPLKRALAPDVWEHVTMEVSTALPPSVRVYLGNDEVLPMTPIDSFPGTLELNAGAYYVTSPTEQWTIFVDNVLLEAFP